MFKTVFLSVSLCLMAGIAMADPLPGTGFIITGEGEPIVDMSVPQDANPIYDGVHAAPDDIAQKRAQICRSVSVMTRDNTVYPAEYVGEVDVYGRAVAPADLPPGDTHSDYAHIVPEKIDIPVRFDVLQAIGIESFAGLDMLPQLGTMTVFKTGRVFFNGRDLTEDFKVICTNHNQSE